MPEGNSLSKLAVTELPAEVLAVLEIRGSSFGGFFGRRVSHFFIVAISRTGFVNTLYEWSFRLLIADCYMAVRKAKEKFPKPNRTGKTCFLLTLSNWMQRLLKASLSSPHSSYALAQPRVQSQR